MMWKNRLGERLDAFSPTAGIYIEDYSRGDVFKVHEDKRFFSASLIKLPVLWTLFEEFNKGNIDIQELHKITDEEKVPGGLLHLWPMEGFLSLEEIGLLMVSVSDNSAANILIDRLGIDRINETMKDLGLKETLLGRKMLDSEARKRGLDNYTSPSDMALIFRHVLEEKRLPAKLCRRFLELLSLQKLQGKLPGAIKVDDVDDVEAFLAHKTGELPGVEHDCGVFFYRTDSPVITVVMTEGLPNREVGVDLCSDIGSIIYDSFCVEST